MSTDSTEPVLVDVTHGPYAGQRLTLTKEVADRAIKEGWGKDPFAPPPAEGDKPPKELDQAKVTEAANKAVYAVRGEPEPDTAPAAEPAPEEAPAPVEPAPEPDPAPEPTSSRRKRY